MISVSVSLSPPNKLVVQAPFNRQRYTHDGRYINCILRPVKKPILRQLRGSRTFIAVDVLFRRAYQCKRKKN